MRSSNLLDKYMVALLGGDRKACRRILQESLAELPSPADAYEALLWPAMTRIDALYREDRINTATEHLATRINRCLADQLQAGLPQAPSLARQAVIICGEGEPEELGAQMIGDLLESRGWTVYFLGGGVPNDEILTQIGVWRPDVLLIYGTQPSGVPQARRLVDMIRDVGVQPTMNILVSGGVFNRADGLWKEINADYFAVDIRSVVDLVVTIPPRNPDADARRRRRRRRLSPCGTQAGPSATKDRHAGGLEPELLNV